MVKIFYSGKSVLNIDQQSSFLGVLGELLR